MKTLSRGLSLWRSRLGRVAPVFFRQRPAQRIPHSSVSPNCGDLGRADDPDCRRCSGAVSPGPPLRPHCRRSRRINPLDRPRARDTGAAFALLVAPLWAASGLSTDRFGAKAILNRGITTDASHLPANRPRPPPTSPPRRLPLLPFTSRRCPARRRPPGPTGWRGGRLAVPQEDRQRQHHRRSDRPALRHRRRLHASCVRGQEGGDDRPVHAGEGGRRTGSASSSCVCSWFAARPTRGRWR